MTVHILLIALFFLLLVSGIVLDMTEDRKMIKTECYDEYYNEIEELTCNKEVWVNEDMQIYSILLIFIGSAGLLLTIIHLHETNRSTIL